MPPNKIPFQVVLHLGSSERNFSIPLGSFCRHEKDAVIDATYLLEFSYVDLEFSPIGDGLSTPARARLYIDGLDGIGSEKVRRDRDGAYLPCPCHVSLYNQLENRPWIPGQYRVKVAWGDENYYTILKVKARYLEDDQLDIMRRELENCVRGLAVDAALPGRGVGIPDVLPSLPERLFQYRLVEKEFPLLYAGVLDILQRPHQQAVKEHLVVPDHKARVWDNRTLRWLSSEQGQHRNQGTHLHPRFVLAPRSNILYDLPENQWIKKIMLDLIKVFRQIQKAIENTLTCRQAELREEQTYISGHTIGTLVRKQQQVNGLEADLARCTKMQGQFWQLLNTPFFAGVSCPGGFVPITPGLQKDYRYWRIFTFWQQLKRHAEIQVQSAAEYQWKRTDLLYEYWCFVKTIEVIKKLGFTPERGWVFSERWRENEPIFIPSIEPGTRVTFLKQGYRLELVYNQSIPYDAQQARDEGIPVWSESENNRPDMRLDVYSGDRYTHSVILEAKYRRLRNIWNTGTEIDRSRWTDNMRQLKNYRLGLSYVSDQDYMSRPVSEVIAIYPGDGEGHPVIIPVEKHRITMVQCVPGRDNEHFANYLRDNVLRGLL